jgi:hypothetical protein
MISARQYILSRIAKNEHHLDHKLKTKITYTLSKRGLDGNGRFRSPVHGYQTALEVLADYGIELDDVVSRSRMDLAISQGRITLDIAFTNKEDPFSPIDIRDSMLVLTFYERSDDNWEVLGYLS